MRFGAKLNKIFSMIRGVLVGLVFAFVGWKLLRVAYQGSAAPTETWLSSAMPMLVLGIWVIVALAALLRRPRRREMRHEQQTDFAQQTDLSPMMYEPPADVAAPPDIPAPPDPQSPPDGAVPPADPSV